MFLKTIIADDSMHFKVSAKNFQVFIPLPGKKNKKIKKNKITANFFI
jgi:hypothetical protein